MSLKGKGVREGRTGRGGHRRQQVQRMGVRARVGRRLDAAHTLAVGAGCAEVVGIVGGLGRVRPYGTGALRRPCRPLQKALAWRQPRRPPSSTMIAHTAGAQWARGSRLDRKAWLSKW